MVDLPIKPLAGLVHNFVDCRFRRRVVRLRELILASWRQLKAGRRVMCSVSRDGGITQVTGTGLDFRMYTFSDIV